MNLSRNVYYNSCDTKTFIDTEKLVIYIRISTTRVLIPRLLQILKKLGIYIRMSTIGVVIPRLLQIMKNYEFIPECVL